MKSERAGWMKQARDWQRVKSADLRPCCAQLMSSVFHVLYWFILVLSINTLILANIYVPRASLWGKKSIMLSKLKVLRSLCGQGSVKYQEDLKDLGQILTVICYCVT